MANASLVTTQTLFTSLSNALNTGTVGGGGSSGGGSTEAFRNMVINGNMIVDQRLEGQLNVTSSNGSYTGPDRFYISAVTTSLPRYTVQRVTVSDADNSVTGHNFSMRLQTTSNVTVSGSNFVGIYHVIEGTVAAPLQWGTSNGRSASLSFYIKTNVTGTHWIGIENDVPALSYITPFTINSADTYTRITKTIPAPPANTVWDKSSNAGIRLSFDVVQPSAQTTANDTWVLGNYFSPAGTYTSNLWSVSNNYVELTGIQFEVGSTATSFEYRPFSLERTLCQRYYEKSFPEGIAPGTIAPQSAPGNAVYMMGSNSMNPVSFCTTKNMVPKMTFYNPYSSNGNAATDTVYSSNLAVFMPNINRFGVTSTESNLWNRNVYFNWTAHSDYDPGVCADCSGIYYYCFTNGQESNAGTTHGILSINTITGSGFANNTVPMTYVSYSVFSVPSWGVQGTYNGWDTMSWTNGTTWKRFYNELTGTWSTSGPTATINTTLFAGSGTIVGRPTFIITVINYAQRQIQVYFPDDKAYTATVNGNSSVITFENASTWTRIS